MELRRLLSGLGPSFVKIVSWSRRDFDGQSSGVYVQWEPGTLIQWIVVQLCHLVHVQPVKLNVLTVLISDCISSAFGVSSDQSAVLDLCRVKLSLLAQTCCHR